MKAVKITFLGKPLKDVYPHATKWQVFKYKFFKAVRWLIIRLSIGLGIGLLTFGAYVFGNFDRDRTLNYVSAATTTSMHLEGLSVAQLEDKLDALVWTEESRGHVMKEGEIYQTFDPPQSWIDNGTVAAKCFKVGGKVNQECYSNGPRQTKIPTIQGKWMELHGVAISDKDAREVAEGNESSRRFFLDCAVQIKGCANLWTGFTKHQEEGQIYIDLIRQAKQN